MRPSPCVQTLSCFRADVQPPDANHVTRWTLQQLTTCWSWQAVIPVTLCVERLFCLPLANLTLQGTAVYLQSHFNA